MSSCSCKNGCSGNKDKRFQAKKIVRCLADGMKNMASDLASKLNIAQQDKLFSIDTFVASLSMRMDAIEKRLKRLEKMCDCAGEPTIYCSAHDCGCDQHAPVSDGDEAGVCCREESASCSKPSSCHHCGASLCDD